MKYAKMMVLAALAVTAFMAMAATSASASGRVCSTETGSHTPTTACTVGHGHVYTGPIHAVNVGEVTLTATEPDNTTVHCAESTVQGVVTNGTTGTGNITALTFAKCKSTFCSLLGGSITASSTASAASPWPVTATTTTPGVHDGNGTLDVTINKTAGKFVCSVGTTCEYSAGVPTVDLTGSDTTPIIHAVNVPLTKTVGPEFTCGKKGDWNATYHVTTPKSLWVE